MIILSRLCVFIFLQCVSFHTFAASDAGGVEGTRTSWAAAGGGGDGLVSGATDLAVVDASAPVSRHQFMDLGLDSIRLISEFCDNRDFLNLRETSASMRNALKTQFSIMKVFGPLTHQARVSRAMIPHGGPAFSHVYPQEIKGKDISHTPFPLDCVAETPTFGASADGEDLVSVSAGGGGGGYGTPIPDPSPSIRGIAEDPSEGALHVLDPAIYGICFINGHTNCTRDDVLYFLKRFQSESLVSLIVSGYGLTADDINKIPSQFPNLRHVNLSHNLLEVSGVALLRELKHIELLNVAYNNAGGKLIPLEAILKKVRFLDISGNPLENSGGAYFIRFAHPLHLCLQNTSLSLEIFNIEKRCPHERVFAPRRGFYSTLLPEIPENPKYALDLRQNGLEHGDTGPFALNFPYFDFQIKKC